MKHSISGDKEQILTLVLDRGEEIVAARGSLAETESGIERRCFVHGGMVNGLKRKLSGSKFTMLKLYCSGEKASVHLKSCLSGRIIPVSLNGQSLICSPRSFICFQGDIRVEIIFRYEGFNVSSGRCFERIGGSGKIFIAEGTHFAEFEEGKMRKVELADKGLAGADFMWKFEDMVSMASAERFIK